MVAFLPLALGAAGLLSSYAKNSQYRPVLEANSRGGAVLEGLGAGLGGFLGGSVLGGTSGVGGLDELLGLSDPTQGLNLPGRQAGQPQYIPQGQLGIAPGESGGIPDALGGLFGGGGDINQLALLAQILSQQQSQGGGGLLPQQAQGGGLGGLLGS